MAPELYHNILAPVKALHNSTTKHSGLTDCGVLGYTVFTATHKGAKMPNDQPQLSSDQDFRLKTIRKALLAAHDADKLWKLLEESLDYINYMEARYGFSQIELKKLRDQNQRQTAMIDNYEKTFLKKK
jgi:hypothetical protein